MVVIRELRKVRGSYCIVLDNGEQYWLRADDLQASGFLENAEYEESAFLRQIHLCQYPRALNHAVCMLSHRPCSKKEIESRLLRLRFTDEVAGLVTFKLEKEGLLNDREFCEQWVRYRTERRFGPSLIRRELRMKGVSGEVIDDVLDGFGADEEQANAVSLAEKAWKRCGPDEDRRKSRQKVIASLVRKGYDWETARSACEAAENELE